MQGLGLPGDRHFGVCGEINRYKVSKIGKNFTTQLPIIQNYRKFRKEDWCHATRRKSTNQDR